MEYKEIRELAALMKEMGLSVLDYNGGSASIRMERAAGAASQHEQDGRDEELPSVGCFTVRSPTVGIFYSAPGPDREPYVSIGDTICAGNVLCVIKDMKIINEKMAERDEIITEVCVQDKQIVEYGQPLFRIKVEGD